MTAARETARQRVLEMGVEDFLALATPEPNTGCWLWTGPTRGGGYGQMGGLTVHRRVLELKLGRPLAPGEVTRHRCDQPACLSPDHVLEGSQRDNIADAVKRGRWACRPGRVTHGQRLAEADVVAIRSAWRAGFRARELAARFGANPSTIEAAAIGRTWRHVEGACAPDRVGRARDRRRPRGTCAVPGCGGVDHLSGLCNRHYIRHRKLGPNSDMPAPVVKARGPYRCTRGTP